MQHVNYMLHTIPLVNQWKMTQNGQPTSNEGLDIMLRFLTFSPTTFKLAFNREKLDLNQPNSPPSDLYSIVDMVARLIKNGLIPMS